MDFYAIVGCCCRIVVYDDYQQQQYILHIEQADMDNEYTIPKHTQTCTHSRVQFLFDYFSFSLALASGCVCSGRNAVV